MNLVRRSEQVGRQNPVVGGGARVLERRQAPEVELVPDPSGRQALDELDSHAAEAEEAQDSAPCRRDREGDPDRQSGHR